MKFRIAPHSGSRSPTRPANALELLWERLGASREGASFTKVGQQITATLPVDGGLEASYRGRLRVLEIVRHVCDGAVELQLDWFAVFVDHSQTSPSSGMHPRVSSSAIIEATVDVPPNRLKRTRTHHEVAPSGWTLVADGRVYEDGTYRGELIRPIKPRANGGATIHFIAV